MTVITTRPNSTVTAGRVGHNAGGSRHAATSDNSDSTHIWTTTSFGDPAHNTATIIGFATPSIPAGGKLKSVALRWRISTPAAGRPLLTEIYRAPGIPIFSDWLTINNTSTMTYTAKSVPISSGLTGPRVGLLTVSPQADSQKIYELYLDTTYVAKPTVGVVAPSGTYTTTNRPTVGWLTGLDPDGGPQVFAVVRIFSQAQYTAGGFNPDTTTPVQQQTVLGAGNQWQPPAALTDGIYRAYVAVAQSVGGEFHGSDWAHSTFTIDTASTTPPPPIEDPEDPGLPPGAPATGVTPEPSNGCIRIDVAISETNLPHVISAERSADGGQTWTLVRTRGSGVGEPVTAAGGLTFYDYEAPNETDLQYRLRAISYNVDGDPNASGYVYDSTYYDCGWWLKHPTRPELNLNITDLMASFPGSQRPSRTATHQPLGASRGVGVIDTPGPESGELALNAFDNETRQKIRALTNAPVPLLLQGRRSDHHDQDAWVVIESAARERVGDKAFVPASVERLSWSEVKRPDGPVAEWPLSPLSAELLALNPLALFVPEPA
jgi:hypothetical protein